MKIKILLTLLVLILALSGCGETIRAPQDTPVPPTTTPAHPPAEAPAAQPPASATLPPAETQPPAAPSDTPLPSLAPTFTLAAALTQAPATATLLPGPVTVTPAAETAAPTLPGGLGPLPVEGQWGGGSTSSFIISFVIGRQNGQATLSDIGLLWFGPNECALNLLAPEQTVITGPQFTRFDTGGDYGYRLTGRILSETLIEGVIKIDVEGCGAPTLNWLARPKSTP